METMKYTFAVSSPCALWFGSLRSENCLRLFAVCGCHGNQIKCHEGDVVCVCSEFHSKKHCLRLFVVVNKHDFHYIK